MYADQVAAGEKRSIKERLNGNLESFPGRSREKAGIKRQRQDDDRWKHDLYEENKEHQPTKPRVGDKDLRLKLQRRFSQQSLQGGKSSGLRDLREKLSGTMHSQLTNIDPPKAKATSEDARITKKSVASDEVAVPEKAASSTPSKKKQKVEPSVDGLLRSLGLEKYIITFQAEEVDMTALTHMTEDDLKALGIPMGPRKKIRRALDSRA